MPQAVHSGALMPASACAAIGVLRDCAGGEQAPEEQRRVGGDVDLHVARGGAVGAARQFGSVPVAPATVAK